ncbi:SubName: Full=Uncharacterized protein {ECO:0000313/EMBL:CCA68081.1} [Serendipita indica DSM 11827]|nr:SubName: Full=Uncharacterized protein {ECO:0000313/EMBL:CCA68081.1} [Serendipita indica DSM 11827]
MPVGPSYLTEVPVEVVENIFSYLHPCEIVQCRIVRADTSIELQLRIELGIDGYLLNSSPPIPACEMLALVLERRTRFQQGDHVSKYRLETQFHGQYEISNGFFAYGINPKSPGVFNGIKYFPLTSETCRTDRTRERLEFTDLGIDLTDFSFSVDDDLQVLVEKVNLEARTRTIYFRTISTNEAHPLAGSPQLVLRLEDFNLEEQCYTLLSHDHIGFGFYNWDVVGHECAQIIYNWRTAEHILPYSPVSDALFLSKEWAALLINQSDFVGISLINLKDGCTLQKFRLPFRKPVSSCFFITSTPKRFRPPTKSDPFRCLTQDPKVQILGIVVTPISGNGIEDDIHIVVSAQRLFTKLEQVQTSTSPPEFVEWEDWGPQTTRWFGFSEVSEASFRSISGSRLLGKLTPIRTDEVWQRELLLIFDFNMRAVRRYSSTATSTEDTSFKVFKTYTSDSELLNAGGSGIDVVSSLSCFATATTITAKDYFDFFLEDHAIIGKAVGSFYYT